MNWLEIFLMIELLRVLASDVTLHDIICIASILMFRMCLKVNCEITSYVFLVVNILILFWNVVFYVLNERGNRIHVIITIKRKRKVCKCLYINFTNQLSLCWTNQSLPLLINEGNVTSFLIFLDDSLLYLD